MNEICIRATKSYRNINIATEEQYYSDDYDEEDYDHPDLSSENDVDRLLIAYHENPVLGDYMYYKDCDYDSMWTAWYYGEIVYIKPEN